MDMLAKRYPKYADKISGTSSEDGFPVRPHVCINCLFKKKKKTLYPLPRPFIKRRYPVLLPTYTSTRYRLKFKTGGRHGCECMVVGFTITHAIGVYHH